MPMPVLQTRPGEYTKVGLETEVKIPWETWKKLLILGPVSIWCFLWIPGWLLWLRVAMEQMSAWRWASREWWPWLSGGGWIWPTIMCFLWWGSAPTWTTIKRFFIETKYKKTPEYSTWNPENGPWTPRAHRQLEYEGPPPREAEAETIALDLTTQPKGGRRKRIQRPEILNTKEARAFYRAVAGGRSFAEATAHDYGISRRMFNKHIRGPFLARKLADWKDAKHKKQGVYLLDDGERTVEGLSQRQ